MEAKQKNGVKALYKRIGNVNLILIGLILGVLVGVFIPETATSFSLLGELFVKALKSVAPILIFVLVAASIARHQRGKATQIKPVLFLYLIGTFAASLTAVVAGFLFPSKLLLTVGAEGYTPPEGVVEVFRTILVSSIDNPINALLEANFIGILLWAIGLGIALHHSSDATKEMVGDLAECISIIVRWVIAFAPIGIFGIVSSTVAKFGVESLAQYVNVLLVLLGSMAILGLVINPLIVYWKIRENPYPLVFACLRESGISAFFTRSSAANIPVNMGMCERMNLDKDTYAISIPLGATINMGGAAITITILTLATTYTLGIHVTLPTALLLSLVATICACGASGVAGGSLLLIPLACSLFGIDSDIAMQVVAVGVAIGVLQDSTETALNSSTDVLFTAAACIAADKAKVASSNN